MWPATNYSEFFRYFGAPREVSLVANGVLRWSGGFSKFASWRSIERATEMKSGDQKNLVEFLKAQLPSSLTEGRMEFTVVDALKEHLVWLACPYSWTSWRDMMERYLYILYDRSTASSARYVASLATLCPNKIVMTSIAEGNDCSRHLIQLTPVCSATGTLVVRCMLHAKPFD